MRKHMTLCVHKLKMFSACKSDATAVCAKLKAKAVYITET